MKTDFRQWYDFHREKIFMHLTAGKVRNWMKSRDMDEIRKFNRNVQQQERKKRNV